MTSLQKLKSFEKFLSAFNTYADKGTLRFKPVILTLKDAGLNGMLQSLFLLMFSQTISGENLSTEIHDLISQLPNLPAPDNSNSYITAC